MKVAVITGANRGIGLEVSRQLSKDGYHVILTARDVEAGQAVAKRLGLEFRPLDVTDPEAVKSFAEKVKEKHGQVDVLVNNAGVCLDGFDYQVVKQTLDVNFFGAMRVTDALLPILARNARVIMVSSHMGELACLGVELSDRFSSDDLTRSELVSLMNKFAEDVAFELHVMKGWPSSAYRVSKVGLNALVRVLTRELADDERAIRVNAVDPGWVRTGLGGHSAHLDVEEAVDTIVWLANKDTEDGPRGGFFRERSPIKW